MNSSCPKGPLSPLLALCNFAETIPHTSQSYWNLLSEVDRSDIPLLRHESQWVLEWLYSEVPGGREIARRFQNGEKAERALVFLLDSLKPTELTLVLNQAHEMRFDPAGYTIFRSVNRISDTLERSKDFAIDKCQMPPGMTEILIDGTQETLTWCCAKAVQLGNRMHRFRNRYSIPETLIYITAWGNPPNDSSALLRRLPELDGSLSPVPAPAPGRLTKTRALTRGRW